MRLMVQSCKISHHTYLQWTFLGLDNRGWRTEVSKSEKQHCTEYEKKSKKWTVCLFSIDFLFLHRQIFVFPSFIHLKSLYQWLAKYKEKMMFSIIFFHSKCSIHISPNQYFSMFVTVCFTALVKQPIIFSYLFGKSFFSCITLFEIPIFTISEIYTIL